MEQTFGPETETGPDIEDYLLRFERIDKTWKWPETKLVCYLVSLLSSKALANINGHKGRQGSPLQGSESCYIDLIDLSPKTYRQCFCVAHGIPGESPTESYQKLKRLYRRWVQPAQKSKEQIAEIIILEQFVLILPEQVRTCGHGA